MSSEPPVESPMTKLTFNDLVALEPRLAHLLTEARSHKPSRKFCANEARYGYFGFSGLKDKLLRLVGWGGRLLRTARPTRRKRRRSRAARRMTSPTTRCTRLFQTAAQNACAGK